MSTPIPERICTTLISRLEAISAANGYSITVPSVDRVQRHAQDWRPRNLSIAVEPSAEVRDESLDHEGNPAAIGYRVEFLLHAFVRRSDRDTTTMDNTTENMMVASIKKAVANSTTWHNFGGVAIDADWGPTRPFLVAEGDHAGQTLSLQVIYRISETDPFTERA